MAKAKFFNKGTIRGTVTKNEIVTFKGKDGKPDGSFLSMEVDTGEHNRVKITMFPTKSSPTRHTDASKAFPVGSKVDVVGNVQEKPYESSNGKKGIDRSLSANAIKAMNEDAIMGAMFILQGTVGKTTENPNDETGTIQLIIDTSYENADKKLIKQEETLVLFADSKALDIANELGLSKGDNAKFKGRFLNSVEMDDYGDIVGSIQMFKIEKIEEYQEKSTLIEQESADFI